jgi:uncharacterized protein YjbI with pentapeptide repeats
MIPQTVISKDLHGERFQPSPGRTRFHGVRVESVDFSGLLFEQFVAESSLFVECDFSRVRFANGHLGLRESGKGPAPVQTIYRDCRFDRADMWSRNGMTLWLGQSRFEKCSFERTKVRMWFSHDAEFVECMFPTRIESCRFFGRPVHQTNPPRQVNEFRDNDFSKADIRGTTFEEGINLASQRWPETDDYFIIRATESRVERAKRFIEKTEWPSADDRTSARVALHMILDRRQDEVLLRWSEASDEATRSVWRLFVD